MKEPVSKACLVCSIGCIFSSYRNLRTNNELDRGGGGKKEKVESYERERQTRADESSEIQIQFKKSLLH